MTNWKRFPCAAEALHGPCSLPARVGVITGDLGIHWAGEHPLDFKRYASVKLLLCLTHFRQAVAGNWCFIRLDSVTFFLGMKRFGTS